MDGHEEGSMISAVAAHPTSMPTFLGIGAPKAGTTWLTEVLGAHPEVVMSAHRKEIHYFDLHFARGPQWYGRFFPTDPAGSATAVGEFTPHYLYDAHAPARVRSVPTITRFVLVLRDPVDRAFSHYRFRQRQDNDQCSFAEFLERHPEAVDWGCYGRHLVPWYEEFDREQFLLLVFERAVQDPAGTRQALADHLGIDVAKFPAELADRANEAFVPRRRRLYGSAVRGARWLRRHQLDRFITAGKRAGLVRLVKRADSAAPVAHLAPAERRALWAHFEDDVALLEDLTGLDLTHWRPSPEEP